MYFLIYKGIEKINNKEKEWFCLFNDSNLYTKRPLFVWKSKNELQKLSIWGLKFEKGTIIYEGYKEKDIPIVKLPYEKVTLKDRMKLVLVRKRKDFTDNKRFLVVTSTCAYEYLSYQEVLYYNQKYGFTNIVKGDIIKTVKGEIPIIEDSKYISEKEAEMIQIVANNDKTFRNFIDDNHIVENLSDIPFDFSCKKSLRDTALFGDSSKILDAVDNFRKKSFMSPVFCKSCWDTIEKIKVKKDGGNIKNNKAVEMLLNNIPYNFLITPCKYCDEVQNFYRFSVLAKSRDNFFETGMKGMVSSLAPYDIIFDKQVIKQDLEGMYIVFHEYVHYLSCYNGNNGFIITDFFRCRSLLEPIFIDFYKVIDLEYLRTDEYIYSLIKTFLQLLTEGMTEIIAGFLLFKECKIKLKKGVYFYDKKEKCRDIKDIKYIYSYPTSDLKVIDEMDSLFKKIEDMTEKEFSIYFYLSPYYTNIQVMLLFIKKIGFSFVLECYFNNRPNLLWDRIKKKVPDIVEFLKLFEKNYRNNNAISSFENIEVQKLIDIMGFSYVITPSIYLENEEIIEDVVDISDEIFESDFIL